MIFHYWSFLVLLVPLLAEHAVAQDPAAAAPTFFHFAIATESAVGTSIEVLHNFCAACHNITACLGSSWRSAGASNDADMHVPSGCCRWCILQCQTCQLRHTWCKAALGHPARHPMPPLFKFRSSSASMRIAACWNLLRPRALWRLTSGAMGRTLTCICHQCLLLRTAQYDAASACAAG